MDYLGATIKHEEEKGSNETIAALLSEVRMLRLAMEQSAAVTPRVQLTLARLNIEEQRTNSGRSPRNT